MTMSENKELEESIQWLTEVLKNKNSFSHKLIAWLITWAATAIWATVVAWLVMYLLGRILKKFDLNQLWALQDIVNQAAESF